MQNVRADETRRLSPFLQALIAFSLLAMVGAAGGYTGYALGFAHGSATKSAGSAKQELATKASDRVACFEWVRENFEKPSAGLMATMCSDKHPLSRP